MNKSLLPNDLEINLTDGSDEEDNLLTLNKRQQYSKHGKSISDNNRRLRIRPRSNHKTAKRKKIVFFCLCVLFMLLMYYMPISNDVPRTVPLFDWGYNISRSMPEYILPNNDTTLLEPKNICSEKFFLLVIVTSSAHNFAARQTIRETWGNISEFNYGMFEKMHSQFHGQYLEPSSERIKYYSDYLQLNKNQTTEIPSILPVRIVFLIGRSKYESQLGNESIARIRNESETFNDIVQENFIDTYNNLTLKSVLALKWASTRCRNSSAFFFKCDDDTFLHLPNLLHYLLGGTIPIYNDTIDYYDKRTSQILSALNRLNVTEKLMMGHLFCSSHPVSDVHSKWYMPSYMYPGNTYPNYLSGAGYLMSMDVVPKLYDAALNTSYVYLEDLYITGMCAERAHMRRRHHPLFIYAETKSDCGLKGIITAHTLKGDKLAEAYNFATNLSKKCPPPSKLYSHRLKLMGIRKCV